MRTIYNFTIEIKVLNLIKKGTQYKCQKVNAGTNSLLQRRLFRFNEMIMAFPFPPGTASLLEDIDKKLMVVLRDGRTLIGYLRSIDQFANLVLHKTIERIHVGKEYGDIPRGVFVVRGENVVLLGEVAIEKEMNLPLKKVSINDILEAQRREQESKQEQDKLMAKALRERGLNYVPDLSHDDMF